MSKRIRSARTKRSGTAAKATSPKGRKVKATATERSAQKHVLAQLDELEAWVKTQSFPRPSKAATKAGFSTRKQYAELISRAREVVKADATLVEASKVRQAVGQPLYYGARTVLTGDYAGFIGKKSPAGQKGIDWVSGPRCAGAFSSQVLKAPVSL